MTSTHVILPGSHRSPRDGARRVRELDSHARVEVTVTIRGPKLPPLGAASKPVSPEEMVARYSARQEDVQQVAQVLRGYGLAVDLVTQAGRSIHVSGSAAAIEAAFRPALGIYHHAAQGEFRGREGELQVPSALDGIVTGVHGLDQRRVAYRKIAATNPATQQKPQTPLDLEYLYHFPRGAADNQVIAIAEFGEPPNHGTFLPAVYLPDDVDAFCARHNRPRPKIQVVPVNIAPLTLTQLEHIPPQLQNAAVDEAGEVMMDVEIIAALCPGATLLVFFASFDQKGWVDLLDRVTGAANGLPIALSISWGMAEDAPDWSSAALAAITERLHIAAMHGITVCVSSGDDGSGDGVSGKAAHVDFPASSPYTLAVGGTQLDAVGSAVHEVTWWDAPGRRTGRGGGASGGGVSTKFPRPAWQNVTVESLNHASIDGRVVPDVAALAGTPMYDLTFFGLVAPSGGTSAAAPLWAALIARINAALPAGKRQRFLTPLLYSMPAAGNATVGAMACRDITSGHNASYPTPGKGYHATVGYDAVTGWGVPNGSALLALLKL